MNEFVRACDSCQRPGHPNYKKKASLKSVPVFQEVFTKLNIDACGPFSLTKEGTVTFYLRCV